MITLIVLAPTIIFAGMLIWELRPIRIPERRWIKQSYPHPSLAAWEANQRSRENMKRIVAEAKAAGDGDPTLHREPKETDEERDLRRKGFGKKTMPWYFR